MGVREVEVVKSSSSLRGSEYPILPPASASVLWLGLGLAGADWEEEQAFGYEWSGDMDGGWDAGGRA